jgi:hypothetical protein
VKWLKVKHRYGGRGEEPILPSGVTEHSLKKLYRPWEASSLQEAGQSVGC